jgi:hypothetical protein
MKTKKIEEVPFGRGWSKCESGSQLMIPHSVVGYLEILKFS